MICRPTKDPVGRTSGPKRGYDAINPCWPRPRLKSETDGINPRDKSYRRENPEKKVQQVYATASITKR